jgi:hypothetical protein
MAATDFIRDLRALGFEVVESLPSAQLAGLVVRFPYVIPLGSRRGEAITFGLIVPNDAPMTCPSGPYMTPHVLPLNNQSSEPPYGGVLAADAHQPAAGFGPDWQYWSRPYNGWAQSERNARAYMRHVAHLFDLI